MTAGKLVVLVCLDCGTDHEATVYWPVCEGDRCAFKCAVCHRVTGQQVFRVGAMR